MKDMTALQPRLLIVDDDRPLRNGLADYFAPYGFAAEGVASPDATRGRIADGDMALVVLDIAVPGGPALLRELVADHDLPVIVHSGACSESERIAMLEMGAEDCVAKPANPRELLARIRSALRGRSDRQGANKRSVARFEGWRIDMTINQLFDPAGAPVPLSEGEFQLLRVFIEHPREVLDRARLLDRVYGGSADYFDRSIDVQLCRLRRKLSACGLKGPVIRTIRNEGYMFVHPVEI